MTELLTIDWVDYTILVFMLILSTGIGLYKGIKSNRSNTIEEYLFGSGNVPIIPVVMSNMASSKAQMTTNAFVVFEIKQKCLQNIK
uniref:Sodium/solute symporter n=1 Tax=Rhodnius prolixus TaxID=13249 RepID=T1HXI8_RHOPR